MTKFTRRQFIRTSSTALAAASVAPLSSLKNLTVAPSDTVNIALIGCRSMGFGDLTNALNVEGVNCIGLCDIDKNILENRAADVNEMTGSAPQLYGDYRKLLENDDLDAGCVDGGYSGDYNHNYSSRAGFTGVDWTVFGDGSHHT